MDLNVSMYKNRMFYICAKMVSLIGYGDLLGRKRHEEKNKDGQTKL